MKNATVDNYNDGFEKLTVRDFFLAIFIFKTP